MLTDMDNEELAKQNESKIQRYSTISESAVDARENGEFPEQPPCSSKTSSNGDDKESIENGSKGSESVSVFSHKRKATLFEIVSRISKGNMIGPPLVSEPPAKIRALDPLGESSAEIVLENFAEQSAPTTIIAPSDVLPSTSKKCKPCPSSSSSSSSFFFSFHHLFHLLSTNAMNLDEK